MRIIYTFLLLFFALQANTQTAPDFTVTDTDGQVHHLYADYLNQGKSVLIKIMFTTCPPCNSIAPLMEPFYEEWGAGELDVEFFEITDKNFDTDLLMDAYASQYGQTFPAISVEGGALETVQPYKIGTFGPFTGTPTFVVIAPDGSVQFDVSGSGNQATINAINAALLATGAQKPSPPLAPDFTITDSNGEEHQLYADYLDQGKSVLIEIFYTTCPPCNSIAPLMEPFYQEWGAGAYDVEFFELSDKVFDTDVLVNAYQNNYGETFIAAGSEGGSLEAVAPYKNGTFGLFTGTPTFIVIAPDGTVQFDVSGGTNEATINALDAALLATGAEKPMIEQPVVISGQVEFLQSTNGVGNTRIQIINSLNNVVEEVETDANGLYDLEILLSETQPGYRVRAVKDGAPLNGVSAVDLFLIQKHILGVEYFDNPYSRIAGNTNGSATLTAVDIVGLLKLLLGISSNFADGKTWIVIPADLDLGPPTNQPPVILDDTILLSDILNGIRVPNWVAIKKGDVNGNANPNE